MQGYRAIPLAEVGDEEFGIFQRFVQRFLHIVSDCIGWRERCTYKVNDFGHLDLSKYATSLVQAKLGGVANFEGVRSLDGDFHWLASVQFSHPFDFAERHEVAIF